jgi:carboxyl-terminal processing protease
MAFASGYWVRDIQAGTGSFPILQEAFAILINHGLKDPPDSPTLEYGMIHGMVQAYADPFTIFVEPVQHQLDSDALHGSFGGIGASLRRDESGTIFLFPFPDSPASKAGIREADQLLAVEELAITPETSLDEVLSQVRGEIGRPVRLTIGHEPNYSPVKVTIVRAEIPLPSVIAYLDLQDKRVGVLEINLIAASTVDEISKAVAALQARGALGFVIDLRNNPGGLLDAGVNIARLFLDDGDVLAQQYRGQEIETYRVERPGPLTDLPVVILVNHASASAAEIIAGALQVHRRAMLIGEPTFGKDTIQLVFNLTDHSSMHVTAARWWIPGLEPPVAGNGLQPDVLVDPNTATGDADPILKAGVDTLIQQLLHLP